MDRDKLTNGQRAGDRPWVVGIGASAGGLEALEEFFDNVPVPAGMAFVVVQHLSPDFKSMMGELLARRTDLPVCIVEHGMQIEPDRVYLIPPGKEMIVSAGKLLLSERDPDQHELALPIDVFFRSLAQDCGPRAAAVVLSGAGGDGSRGIRDVHEAGGLVLVQEPETAQFDGMPRAAREVGVARSVLRPRDMPRALLEHARDGWLPEASEVRGHGGAIDALYGMLEEEFGIDFTHYKPSTVTRRIERRLSLAQAQDVERYVARLRDERDELDRLYRDLLIGVTRFFRNEQAFEAIEQRVLPELLRRGKADTPLRVWVAGCATGEEAYSLAMIIQDAIARLGATRTAKIFATDVHQGSLERAARGVYDEQALAHVSAERVERYFHRVGRSFHVMPELRQMIVFAPHNVIRDAPFTRVDLVTCRNLLIYFQPPAQQKVLSLFHFALNRGGVLMLGPSESTGPLSTDYEIVDKHWRIYRKFSDVRVPVDARLKPARFVEPPHRPPPAGDAMAGYSLSQLVGTYDTLLERFMPPSLLVDEHGRLVHAFAGASRFVRVRDGRTGLDLMDLVGDELKMVLVGGIRRALSEQQPVVFNGVQLPDAATGVAHRVTVQKLAPRNGGRPHVVVSFEPTADASRAPAAEVQFDVREATREQIGTLEAELRSTRENLQAAIEQLEASNEELQAANEELLASNEELQSTNEELQSVNEELYTVNAEHQRKIAELVELTNDVNNLLSSTDVGTVFLDAELRIRKFTPQIAQAFNLVEHDVGRPIEAFAHTLRHPDLVDDLRRCATTGQRVERELTDVRGRAFFLRILPYQAKAAIEGVVLTLIDVSSMKATEDALFRERHLLDGLLFSVPDAIYFKDVQGRFVRINPAMATRLGIEQPPMAVGKTLLDLLGPSAAAWTAVDDAVVQSGQAQHYVLEKVETTGGATRWDLVTRMPLRDRHGGVVGVIGVMRDVTREKAAEDQVREAVRRRDEFLAMLSHELRNPLAAIVTASRLLQLPDGAVRKRAADTIERQSGQMGRLLEDLLEANRVTQNKIELRTAALDLREAAAEAVEAVRPAMDARGVSLAVEMAPAPVVVLGDAARLQQVHVNLLNNAAKYTPRGGHVLLRVACEGECAVVRVRDDGVGIAPEMLESIFELFVQAQRTLERSDGGLGLGLTLVRSLVTMHGGTVAAHSDGLGKGSEFVVRLPLSSGASPEASPPRMRRPSARPGLKVVLVEDNDDCRRTLATYLGHKGFECRVASSGPAALELIERWRPDVAVLDIGLPEMDGLEVARRLRRDPRNAQVYLVALTGYGRATDAAATRAAGFDDHVVKPVDPDELAAHLAGEVGTPGREPPSIVRS